MSVKRTNTRRKLLCTGFALFLSATLLQTTACHRSYYRRQADTEAVKLITEKANDPHWALPDRTIDIDPRSRMAHPFSSDHPPMPPDDPTSAEFMECVDGKPGFPHWNANGNLSQVENPDWMSFVPVNEDGVLELDLNRAVQVAYLHSPTYQGQRETLYLSALDVSLERFGFDAQLFASYNTFLTGDGRIRGGGNSRTTLAGNTGNRGVRLEKLGITGSTFVVGLANTLLWQFSGTDTHTASSLVDFSLVQPLLRGAGRERILESLTQAERTLLANVRQMERYRRGFYLNITIGRNPGQGPSRGGGFLNTPSSQGSNAGGFLGLIQSKQDILIQEYNVSQLRDVLLQFRFMQDAQKIDALQVTQVETQLYREQQRLFQLITSYEASLDQFKINLGLPPEMKIDIDDPLLEKFQLVDVQATRIQDDINDLSEEASQPIIQLNNMLNDPDRLIYEEEEVDESPDAADGDDFLQDPLLGLEGMEDDDPILESIETRQIAGLVWGDDIDRQLEILDQYIELIDQVRMRVIQEQQRRVREDIQELRESRDDIVESLRSLADIDINNGVLLREANGRLSSELMSEAAIVEPDLLDATVQSAIDKLENEIPDALQTVRQNIRDLRNNHPETQETFEKLRDGVVRSLPDVLSEISNQSLELLLQQALARTDQLSLQEVQLDPEMAIAIARHFRRDWMNARASLVDAWRQIEFQADQLESTFDLVLEGDVGTVGDNPLNFRTANGRLRGGFRFDSPITRMQERNSYRQALINYQQSRRRYYQVRDEIARNLRQILRQIQLNKILFELNRLQIKVGVQQVDQARFAIREPLEAGRSPNPTLGRNLTDAINNLQGAQSSYLNTYVGYEVLRRGLDFDLGTMQLDDNSLWIDPGPINREFVDGLIQEDQRLLQELGVDQMYESVDQFLEETAPDLDGVLESEDPNSLMNDPINGQPEVDLGGDGENATEGEQEQLLQDLRKRLRSELVRTASVPRSETTTASRPKAPSAAPSGLPSSLKPPSSPYASDAAGLELEPVEVSSAFPKLSGSRRPANSVEPGPSFPPDQSRLPTTPVRVSPNRFLPVIPETLDR